MKFGSIPAEMHERILDLREIIKHKPISFFGQRQIANALLQMTKGKAYLGKPSTSSFSRSLAP